jgi:hypothetical protein
MNLTGQIKNLSGIITQRIYVWTILFGLLVSSTIVNGATFYIDPTSTSSATPDGSEKAPFKSWDNIPWVASSSYLQKRGTTCVVTRVIKPTGDNVTLGAYGSGSRPVIKSLVGDRAKAIEISVKKVLIKDLEVYSTNDIVCAILLGGDGPHVVDNCVLHHCSWGIRVFNMTGKLTISNSTIHDVGDDGIYTENTEDVEIFGCNIYRVNADLPERETAGGDCIQISGDQGALHIHDNILDHSDFGRKFCLIVGSAYSKNDPVPDEVLVENNVLIGFYDSEEVTSGVYLKESIKHLTFRYNIVKNAATGIWLNANTTAHNNIFIGCTEAVTLNSGKTAEIYNNTFVNNYIGVNTNYGSVGYVYNNIFADGDYTHSYYSLYGDITCDKNCFSSSGNKLFNGFNTLSEWVAHRGRDANSIVADPEFVNVDEENFHIKSSSKCKDQGMVIEMVKRDFDGNVVPLFDGPDIGAYEYTDGSGSAGSGDDTNSNKAPKILVNYSETTPIGIVSTLDASESFDPNDDALSYSWVAPKGIALSSDDSPEVQIMPEDGILPDEYTVQLLVSDGENTVSKDIKVNVVPLNPDVVEIGISSIEASKYQAPNYPENLIDNDYSTRWAARTKNEWVLFELETPAFIDHIKLAFFRGIDRIAYFEVSGSVDKENWQPLMTEYESCGFTETNQAYPLEENKASKVYKYVKVTGLCNSQNDWNSFTEFKVYGMPSKGITTISEDGFEQFKVFPNPAEDLVNLSFEDMTGTSAVQVLDMNGRVVLESTLSEVNGAQLNTESLNEGVYFIQVLSSDAAYKPQRLIIR